MKHDPNADLRNKSYGQLDKAQQERATQLILSAYFNNTNNGSTAIAKITGLKHSLVSRIITMEIIPGRDLRALKAQYTLRKQQIAKTLLGVNNH